MRIGSKGRWWGGDQWEQRCGRRKGRAGLGQSGKGEPVAGCWCEGEE